MSKFIPNSFQIPNAFVDEAMNKISDASVKIYLLIVRKTRGWAKEFDSLSLSQLESLSGKSRPTVVKCLKELVNVGLINKHTATKYGDVYSLIDNYNIGQRIKFTGKKSLLVKAFSFTTSRPSFVLVKNFNQPQNEQNKSDSGVKRCTEIRLKFTGKKSLLVKNFYPTSKEFLPLLVKNFYPQKTLSKDTNQNKKNGWLDLEKLKGQIMSTNRQISDQDFVNIMMADWYHREYVGFEKYNAKKNHDDENKISLFADWLLNARAKYSKQKINSHPKTQEAKSLTDPQINRFARLLAEHTVFAGSVVPQGYVREQSISWIASRLRDPAQLHQWEQYLRDVGFSGKLPDVSVTPAPTLDSVNTVSKPSEQKHKPVKVDVKAMLRQAQADKANEVTL